MANDEPEYAEYEIETILNKRVTDDKVEYLVKWVGYPCVYFIYFYSIFIIYLLIVQNAVIRTRGKMRNT
jgi:hypothetical protein